MKNVISTIAKKNKLIILLVVSLQALSYVLVAIIPYLNGKYVDLLLSGITVGYLIKYSVIIIIIGLISILISYIFKLLNTKCIYKFSFELYLVITKHIQKIPLCYLESYNPSYLNQRITNDTSVISKFIFDSLIPIFMSIIQSIALFTIILKFNSFIFISALIFILIYLLLYILFKKKLFNSSQSIKESQNFYYSKTNETYELNFEIRTHSDYEDSNVRTRSLYNNYLCNVISYIKVNSLYNSVENMIGLLFQSIVLIYGGTQVINGLISLGEYTVINVYFSMLLSSLKVFIHFGQVFQDAKSSAIRIKDLLKIPKEDNGDLIVEKINQLTLHNLQYRYLDTKDNMYNNYLNICLEPGKIVNLIGKNGSGKTTLLKLIVGLLKKQNFDGIKYNDISLSNIDLYHLRKDKISVMLQNEKVPIITTFEFLFNEPYSEYSETKVVQLLDEYKLNDIFLSESFNVLKFLNTNINTLSGGERQLILILRTLIKKADFYIFDEPTSNLTVHLSAQIMKYLNTFKNNKIILIIAHSNEVKEYSDIIYNIDI